MRWYHWCKILGSASFIAIGLYLIMKYQVTETAESMATILGPVIALIGLGLIFWQLRDNAIQARRTRTYEFSSKIQDGVFYDHIYNVETFFDDTETADGQDKCWSDFQNKTVTKEVKKSLFIVFAYFEDLGLMYSLGLVDREMIKQLLRSYIIHYFEMSSWFIVRLRIKKDNEKIYKEWQTLYNSLR